MSPSDADLLARIEDASLNASAPTQQRWIDGWLVRTSPGKAQRARSINPVATGRLPLDDKLLLAAQVYKDAGLPMIFRLTPFSQPHDLDASLHARGWRRAGQTQVLIRNADSARGAAPGLPVGCSWHSLDGGDFATAVGALRGSPVAQQRAHTQRLANSPVPYRGFAIRRQGDHAVVCCGQFAREGRLVGLYDVHTAVAARRQGLAQTLCERLLLKAEAEGATWAYLQVEADNQSALAVYRRLGFQHGYDYHYRHEPIPA